MSKREVFDFQELMCLCWLLRFFFGDVYLWIYIISHRIRFGSLKWIIAGGWISFKWLKDLIIHFEWNEKSIEWVKSQQQDSFAICNMMQSKEKKKNTLQNENHFKKLQTFANVIAERHFFSVDSFSHFYYHSSVIDSNETHYLDIYILENGTSLLISWMVAIEKIAFAILLGSSHENIYI